MALNLIGWLDLIIIGAGIGLMIWIGVRVARKNVTSDAYFMAGRNLPGWCVGLSILATMISSITFLAAPGFAFAENWRYLPQYVAYIPPLFVAMFLFMPFFRRTRVSTAYEYLERRFGSWARLYSAGLMTVHGTLYLGVIIYTISLPFQILTGWDIRLIIIIFGVLAASYTIAGGLEAVIWTDVIQGIALMGSGLICLPIIAQKLPGGLGQILTEGYADGKMSLGSMEFTLQQKTFWVMLAGGMISFLTVFCTNQTFIQRYGAAKSDREARKSMIVGAMTCVPVWIYFMFIGTALYVFYKVYPVAKVAEMKPEQVFPYFIFTQIPTGFKGFILVGLLAAALSSLDSLINALASIITGDFYRRLFRPNRSERHYVSFGRWASFVLASLMVGSGIYISQTNTTTLADLFQTIGSICAGGLLGLFLLGFLTRRVGSRETAVVISLTVMGTIGWLFMESHYGRTYFPQLSARLPDLFWLQIMANVFVFVGAYFLSLLRRNRSAGEYRNLTIWTCNKKEVDVEPGQ